MQQLPNYYLTPTKPSSQSEVMLPSCRKLLGPVLKERVFQQKVYLTKWNKKKTIEHLETLLALLNEEWFAKKSQKLVSHFFAVWVLAGYAVLAFTAAGAFFALTGTVYNIKCLIYH